MAESSPTKDLSQFSSRVHEKGRRKVDGIDFELYTAGNISNLKHLLGRAIVSASYKSILVYCLDYLVRTEHRLITIFLGAKRVKRSVSSLGSNMMRT